MRQIWSVAQDVHDRLCRLIWFAGWTIPLVAWAWRSRSRLGVRWSPRASIVAQQIDYENEALCARFGFAVGTDKHFACKLDLLDLRHSHENMLAENTLP